MSRKFQLAKVSVDLTGMGDRWPTRPQSWHITDEQRSKLIADFLARGGVIKRYAASSCFGATKKLTHKFGSGLVTTGGFKAGRPGRPRKQKPIDWAGTQ